MLSSNSSLLLSFNRIPLVIVRSILTRASSSGTPSKISLSNRPARRKAGSNASGRLVAANTKTACWLRLFCGARLSMLVRSCATMRFSMPRPESPLPPLPRFGATASISSKNINDGAMSDAAWNKARIRDSDSPDTPATSSGADTRKNGTPNCPATAFAK